MTALTLSSNLGTAVYLKLHENELYPDEYLIWNLSLHLQKRIDHMIYMSVHKNRGTLGMPVATEDSVRRALSKTHKSIFNQHIFATTEKSKSRPCPQSLS
jgi:hypothetical protein